MPPPEKTSSELPAITPGLILLWYGNIASVPAGWQLCDGTNGTPDLRNRFIVCADADAGGVAMSTITGAPLQIGGNIEHFHVLPSPTIPIRSGTGRRLRTSNKEHIPSFYALAYIMKL